MARPCEKCGKEANASWKRCVAHYNCDSCGTVDELCAYCEGVFCDECRKVWVANKIANFAGDTEHTSQIVCPHCGYVSSDSWEMSEGEQRCNDCDLDYEVSRYTDVTYTTVKLPPRK
jgi:hypothetical protein